MSPNHTHVKPHPKSRSRSLWLPLAMLIIGGWLLATAYIGMRAEQQVRTFLVQLEKRPSSQLYFELLEYNRAFFNAYSVMRLRSKDPEVDTAVESLVLRTRIKHGPLVFNQTDLQLATASFSTTLDKSSLNSDTQALVKRLFADKEPFVANMLVKYGLQKHYQWTLSAFEYQVADMSFSASAGSATGIIQPEDTFIPMKIKFEEILFKQGRERLHSRYNQVTFSLLNDCEKTTFDAALTNTAKVDYSGLSVNLDTLQAGRFIIQLKRYEDRYHVDQQIAWTLELAAQHQEGQDRLQALYREQGVNQLPDTGQMVSHLFKDNLRDISFTQKSEHHDANLAYNPL